MSRAPQRRLLTTAQVVQATALSHTVDGVTLELDVDDGCTLVIAHRRLDAHLDPCQLRRLILSELEAQKSKLLCSVVRAEIVAGLEEIGAGMHRRSGPAGEERLFSTTLSDGDVCAMFAECPQHPSSAALRVRALPDLELGVTIVRLTANHPSVTTYLDDVSSWALGAAMARELIESTQTTPEVRGDRQAVRRRPNEHDDL